nr:hypothetical protein [Lacticaseibacillus camelliae]
MPKTYLVTLASPLTPAMAQQLAHGITFQEFTSAPATVVVRPASGQRLIELTIHEGKFHQVKRMLKAVGNQVTALARVQMGPLQLPPDLAPGHYRSLTAEELGQLLKAKK